MSKNLDFIYMFIDELNKLKLMSKVAPGGLKNEDSIAVSLLPGSKTISSYYDGTKEKIVYIQVSIKTKNQKEAIDNLNIISDFVENLEELKSSNGSFQFMKMINSSEPFHQSVDENNNWIFVFDTSAQILIR